MSYAPENIRLSHRQRAPPLNALKPPLLVRVSNWDRSTPSVARTCSNDKSPDLRSGWKFTVTRNVGSSGGPNAYLATADSALNSADSGSGVHMGSLFSVSSTNDQHHQMRWEDLPLEKPRLPHSRAESLGHPAFGRNRRGLGNCEDPIRDFCAASRAPDSLERMDGPTTPRFF